VVQLRLGHSSLPLLAFDLCARDGGPLVPGGTMALGSKDYDGMKAAIENLLAE
jgi:hypothetical protein